MKPGLSLETVEVIMQEQKKRGRNGSMKCHGPVDLVHWYDMKISCNLRGKTSVRYFRRLKLQKKEPIISTQKVQG